MDKIKEIISEYTGTPVEKITDDMNFQTDIGLDSLGLISMITEIEDEYGIHVEDEELYTFQTLKDLYDFIDRKKNS